MDIQVVKATVLLRDHLADIITIITDLPSPVPPISDEPASFVTYATIDTGAEWVRKNLGIEPIIIYAGRKTN